MELSFSPEENGVSFNCKNCPTRVQELRRCREPREDFDGKDGAIWPMYVFQGGELYSHCPGKATWDQSAVSLFQLLITCAETKALPYAGGVTDQPDWIVELLGWFLPKYDMMKFIRKADMILGSTKDGKSTPQPRRGK